MHSQMGFIITTNYCERVALEVRKTWSREDEFNFPEMMRQSRAELLQNTETGLMSKIWEFVFKRFTI